MIFDFFLVAKLFKSFVSLENNGMELFLLIISGMPGKLKNDTKF